MKKHITLFILCMFLSTIILGQTQLQGKVSEEATGEPVLFGTVALIKDGVPITGTDTDFDGKYYFSDLDPGTYDVEVRYLGLQTQRIEGVIVKEGKVTPLNFLMKEEGVMVDVIEVVGYKVPLIEMDNTTSGNTLTSEAIEALPTKAISSIAATTAGVSVDQDGDISIRGSRDDATFYYIDGIRVSADNAANMVPQAEIEQLQVITGGIEAKYGDVIGGVISITSKGPSAKYSGGIELETSEFLDAYGYNLVNANLSGPILKKTMDDGSEKSILGFRLFGQYRNVEDDDPSAIGVYRAPRELIEQLEQEPIKYIDGSPFPAPQFLTAEDIGDPIKARPNEADRDYNFSAKLDARLSDNMDVTLSGSYYDSKNQFSQGTTGSRAIDMFNWTNNPFALRSGYRGSFRFRHKLGRQGVDEDAEKSSLIRNATYTLQFGYERGQTSQEDAQHGSNLFNYGYYGKRDVTYERFSSEITDPNWGGDTVFVQTPTGLRPFAFQGVAEVQGEFTPDANINTALSLPDYNDRNGFRNQVQSNVFEMFENVGRVYNLSRKTEEDRYTINVNSGFDLFPGQSESGKHSIQFGFMYEQRVLRRWEISPISIWETMRANANRHIQNGVNTDISLGIFMDPVSGQMINEWAPNNQADEFPDNKFFRSLRELTGDELTDFVNVDAIDPSEFSLDMFSPGELNGNNAIGLNYYGYDYLGNKLPTTTSFDDFFTGVDGDGRRTFNVAPFNPNYIAGYIQDKFTFKDIIFRLGVRLDYYDANTKVLKDPYAFSDIKTADQFFNDNPELTRPGSIEDDYKVYVNDDGSSDVVGYRRGDVWYEPNGTVTDPILLFGQGGLVFPSYVEEDDQKRNPQYYERTEDGAVERFDPNSAFDDYDPQLNVMPRLAFSFPISEDAGFFAHYDVLVQRPNPLSVTGTPLQYYFFEDAGRFSSSGNPAENPDLRPEKTVDYEVGFQQKISNSSAIKVSAYYKELRDMIQRRTYAFIPTVGNYETYSNLDFGTIKGFTFAYDLRRTSNFQLNANYALQFANGTGSGRNSAQGLNANRNIRTLLPLSYDERHSLTLIADYRYGSGNAYDGPRIGGLDILSNFGANLLINAISGRPYSTFDAVENVLVNTTTQAINETRLPWVFRMDLQLDKNFALKLSEEATRKINFNVYLRVQNLFDLDNIVGVYEVTQSPDDSGWLNNGLGIGAQNDAISNGFTADNYTSSYAWRILDPNNYARPRQIFLGTIINF